MLEPIRVGYAALNSNLFAVLKNSKFRIQNYLTTFLPLTM